MPNEFEFLINVGRLFQISHPLSKSGRIFFIICVVIFCVVYNLCVIFIILCAFLMRIVEIII